MKRKYSRGAVPPPPNRLTKEAKQREPGTMEFHRRKVGTSTFHKHPKKKHMRRG